jgi:hypothetical protein
MVVWYLLKFLYGCNKKKSPVQLFYTFIYTIKVSCVSKIFLNEKRFGGKLNSQVSGEKKEGEIQVSRDSEDISSLIIKHRLANMNRKSVFLKDGLNAREVYLMHSKRPVAVSMSTY